MHSSKEVINLIKQLRKRKKLSVEELAKRVGIAKSTLSRYENNQRKFPINDVGKYAEALGVSVEYLLGIEEKPKNTSYSMQTYPYIPVSISAGLPIDVDPIEAKDIETISLPDSVMGKWARRKDIFIMRVNGESMNKIIPHKSLIAVKQIEMSQLKDGDIVVYSDDTSYAVKHFYNDKVNEKLIFRPASTDNSFTDYIVPYNSASNVKIHGKVVLYIVELD